ncbi:MAG TPA: nitroreductase family deazaflavin-dependent oxidoreductase [Mycobacterium sp.]|nr:nitroreductase family deazaflavin-dependent oxidoreductase [Mycobacterium sp.]
MKLLLKLIVVLAAAVVTVIVGALAAIRWQIEPALTGVRKLNKAVTNRGALRAAGTESSGTAVVVHRGRRSGKTFRTPVHLDRVQNAFVIALAYGDGADWVRNVLANGGAVIELGGTTFVTKNPEVLPSAEVLDELPPRQQRAITMFGVAKCLRLQIVVA